MRIFIAIDLPLELKNKISGFVEVLKKKENRGIKYVAAENLHLTLKFIGEIGDKNLKLIIEALSKISFKPFNLELKSTGCFPTFFNPRVLWIGTKDEDSHLFDLYKNIVSNLPEDLIKKDEHDFSPHLTIARFKSKPSNEFINFLKSENNHDFGEFSVKSFCVYESMLKPSGAVYTKLKEFFCK
ncbi:MAG: RNA 2',3'-cyclic phosphodiesterase [Brevinematia bacterium]